MSGERLLTGHFLRLWIANFGAFGSFGFLLLALPLYARDELAASDLGVGCAVGASAVGAVLFSAPAGRIADRRGRRIVMLVGAAGMTVGYAALALGPALPVVVAIRFVAGAFEAAYVVGGISAATDMAPPNRRGEAVSLITISSYLGVTAGPVVADLLLGDGRFGLVWLAAAAFVALPSVVLVTLRDTRPESEEGAPAGWLPPRSALFPGLLVFIGLLGFGGYNAFAALYGRTIDFHEPGLLFGLFGLVIVVIRTLGRRLPDRLGSRPTLAVAFASLAVGLTTVGLWNHVVGLFLGTVVFAAGQALVYPAAALLALESAPPSERSAALGSVGAAVDVALGVGAFVLGGLAEQMGYAEAFLLTAAVPLGGLVLLASLRRGRLSAVPSES